MKNMLFAAPTPKEHGLGPRFAYWALLCAVVAAAFAPTVQAAATSLSNRPLATRPNVQVKPNLMFILDDSGSMNGKFMPDTMNDYDFVTKITTVTYGTFSVQCNGLAYDPSMSYAPPVKADGTAYSNITFTSAWDDGFSTSSTSTKSDLTGTYYYLYQGSQPKMSWAYTQTGVVKNTFYDECRMAEATPSSLFTKVTMTGTSPDAQNYANWYSYYSKRYLLMRTAVGRSIVGLDTSFRVGFSTITDPYAANGGGRPFLDVKDFDSVQKANFYSNLYNAKRNTNTPLRGALSKAGRYFANMAPLQNYDPVQYSCQRNYALLTTDGYWDTNRENNVGGGTPKYGPYKLDNTALVGDQDGGQARPMKDVSNSPDTLADVAQYYYATDLRTPTLGNCTSTSSGATQDTCGNSLRPVPGDPATWQHMNTYTVGMGVNGTLAYDKNYLTQTTGAYADISNGIRDWPVPTVSTSDGDATNIDDLWHTAVNGRGQYFMALDAGSLVSAISDIVAALKQVEGAASAASTSSLELVPGNNNQAYRASYTTESWTGDLQAFSVNGADGAIAAMPSWSAQAKLDATTPAARKIYFSGGSGLQDFQYANLNTTQRTYFDNICVGKPVLLDQCPGLAFADKTIANSGDNLVNYLRGVRSYETAVPVASAGVSVTTVPLYRKRTHLLGDIVNGAPVQVGKPPFSYGDSGYAAFVAAQASRKNVVYAAANDGMLHALSAEAADGGSELWAYVPGAVMPNLYKLADVGYASKHQYNVDGAPVMADISVGGVWKTILVGGLNSGGHGYYALDITDPVSPKALWEFTDPNMGLSYGNPVVTKRADGTWVVAFASGYNNGGGDGLGHLYVVNANSGAKLLDIPTGAGSPANPSGLAKINSWIDDTADNTSKRFYGGDLQGNLWRFDIDNLVAPNQAAMLLATFQTSAATPQPITTQPVMAEVAGKPVVVVGTGQYLGVPDITDTSQQSIYAVKDPLTATGWGDVRANTAGFVKQTLTLNGPAATATGATVSDIAVDWGSKAGWWMDLPQLGERVNTNPKLQADTLAIATSIPDGGACSLGGASWKYYLDISNGGVVSTALAGEQWSISSLIVGMNWIKDSSGRVRLISQGSNGEIRTEIPPIPSIAGAGVARRTSWRELAD